MNCTIKKIVLLLVLPLLFSSCIIQDPKPEDCDVKEIVVTKIYEGGTLDIVFAEENGDFYYINRGLEQGFTLSEMEETVLNKKVTLHLAKVITGTSNHIAQLALEEDVIYTEFK